MARTVTEAELEIATGKAKHARLLERFVKQLGLAAMPVLEQCVQGGSKKMSQTAWALMGALDPAQAERAALLQASQAEDASKRDRKGMLEVLQRVGTPACFRRMRELGAPVSAADLEAELLPRAFPFLEEELRAAADPSAWLTQLLKDAPRYDRAWSEAIAPFFRAQLDRELDPDVRAALVDWLIKLGDLETCRRGDLSPTEHEAGALRLPAAECFDRLAPAVRDEPARLRSLAHQLQARVDPRWIPVYLAHARTDPELAEHGLCHLPCEEAVEPLIALAEPLPWELRLRELLFALGRIGDPRARGLLLRWLPTPEGRSCAALLLTALNKCGLPEDLPLIEAEAAANPESRPFYVSTAEFIRARAGR